MRKGIWYLEMWLVLLLVSPVAAEAPRFQRLEIAQPQFTPALVGLLQLELEKVANFLGLYVYQQLAPEIRAGKAESRLRARRYLSLALHVDPQNLIAKRINAMLGEGSTEVLETALPQSPQLFAEGAVRLIKLLGARSEPNAARLAGFLALVAADLDPQQEEAIYAAEIFTRKVADISAAWKALALGEAAGK